MSKGTKPSSSLHWAVREQRGARRYKVGTEWFSERTRLALHAFADVFGREDDDTLYAGALAGRLGDGNGWTAATTIRSFLSRGWVVEARDKHSALASWITHYRITDDGLRMLRVLDELHKGEVCPACKGESPLRNVYAMRGPQDEACEECGGTRLRLKAVVS